MAEDMSQLLQPVGKPLNLIPVIIKEAALDSPTFRATAVHFGEQLDIVERWLETYIKSVGKLAHDVGALQSTVDSYLQAAAPPLQLSEAVLDHDYTVLALKRFGEGAKEYWQSTLRGMKKVENAVVEPIRSFLHHDIRMLRDARKVLEQAQRSFDAAVARYSGQAKTKEASSLREDAFQLHEARRAYLKASMDFCVMAPQVRGTLDKLLVKIVSEQWRDMKSSRESSASCFARWGTDMDRVRGWSREMENGERVFKRELHMARQQIETTAELEMRPSRELDDYAISTVPYLGTQAPSSANLPSAAKPGPAPEKAEKQGWLFQRTLTGKPARTYWVRRWFFVKNGIFGWLAQGSRSGAVEESEKIGVLLCGIRPAFQEERRFCFEVKTKDTTILLQAETQHDLTEWISSFEVAKRKALEDTAASPSGTQAGDAAFSISPPIAPEFAARNADGHGPTLSDDLSAPERSETLPIPGSDPAGNLASRSSFDVSGRKGTGFERDGESSSRDHAARIIQKLDLTRKSTAGPQLSGNSPAPPAGGIASLISASLVSASHNIMPVGQMAAPAPGLPDPRSGFGQNIPTSSLAPSTLANPPAPTNLSKAAVAVSGERNLGLGRSGGMPGGLMANLWGSMNWGYVNRLERGEEPPARERDRSVSQPPSPVGRSPGLEPLEPTNESSLDPSSATATPLSPTHRKTVSMGGPPPSAAQRPSIVTEEFPNYYPLPLRVQDAQFKVLFPNVPRDQKVVLVFRAVWNPTDQQEFPGRVFVTTKDIYFYSNHLGLVLITGISLASIEDVTAAPGRDCDFLYLHFKPGQREDNATRITIKTFLEPLRLLQKRLNYLVQNASLNTPLEEVIKTLIKLEVGNDDQSPSGESWEDVPVTTPMDPGYSGKDVKASLRIDGNLFGPPGVPVSKNATKFKLPSHAVVYAPLGMTECVVEKEFDISAKALFHVMFGDKSAVFQMLYRARWAQRVVQGPWTQLDQGLQKRDFEYEVAQFSKSDAVVINDYQVIDVLTDHLCYVITDKKTPWYLPLSDWFMLVSKIVITHVAKSKCKLAIYTKVDWAKTPSFTRTIIERQGLRDLRLEALDLADVITDQVSKLGSNSRTGKAVQIFGQIGQVMQTAQFAATDIPAPAKQRRFKLKPRSLASVMLQLFANALLSALSTLVGWFMSALGAIVNICSAHTLLIGLLLVSGFANFFYTSRDSYQWWNERSAGKFMSRLGVGPGVSMSRSVYLRDIEDGFLHTNTTSLGFAHGRADHNRCQSTFTDILVNPETSKSHSTRRLDRTRQHLGSYRHDLLVALRVVNRIEKEVLEAEYESWLVDEMRKCDHFNAMINSSEATASGKRKKSKSKESDISAWMKSYCGDCRAELAGVEERATSLI